MKVLLWLKGEIRPASQGGMRTPVALCAAPVLSAQWELDCDC